MGELVNGVENDSLKEIEADGAIGNIFLPIVLST